MEPKGVNNNNPQNQFEDLGHFFGKICTLSYTVSLHIGLGPVNYCKKTVRVALIQHCCLTLSLSVDRIPDRAHFPPSKTFVPLAILSSEKFLSEKTFFFKILLLCTQTNSKSKNSVNQMKQKLRTEEVQKNPTLPKNTFPTQERG